MKSKTIKKLYTLHSWVGIITGILLFVIAFTGAVSVFGGPELKLWSNPEIRAMKAMDPADIEKLVEEYAAKVPEHYLEEVLIFLPGPRNYKNLTVIFEAHSGAPEPEGAEASSTEQSTATKPSPAVGIWYEFDPVTLELVNEKRDTMENIFLGRESDMADFIVHFHADLHLGRPIGLLTTGVLGLTMMLSIVTGIFIHRKILKQMFTFRPRKNLSLMLNDGHKAIGVWGLLFNSTIAFTGAFLGLALVILVPAAAFVSFGGDQEKLIETFTALPEPEIQHIAAPTQIAAILEHATNLHEEVTVNAVTVMGYGDASAVAYVGIFGGESVASQTAVYKGAEGSFVEHFSNFDRIEGYSGKVLDLMFPLHFGNFGGILVKFIWGVLGIGTALLPLTGLMLWMERGVNAANPKYSMKTYQRFNRLIVGGCGGIVITTLSMFPAQMLIKYGLGIDDVGTVIGWVFFPVWILVLLWGAFAPCEKRAAKQMAYVCAGLLLSVMPIDIIASGSHVFNLMSTQHFTSVGVDLVCLALGCYLLYIIKKFEFYGASQGVKQDPSGLAGEAA